MTETVCVCVCPQKLAVRTCPVGTTKPLSLIKPPGQGISIAVVPAKAPVSMVTAHINGQKAASSEPLQTTPINLQTAGRVAFSSRRAGEAATQVRVQTHRKETQNSRN